MFPLFRLLLKGTQKKKQWSRSCVLHDLTTLFHGTVQRPDTLPLRGTKDRIVTETFAIFRLMFSIY